MTLSKFTKATLITCSVALLLGIAITALNIYWYSDEVEPALEDCVGPHLKVIVNAILLIITVIAAVLFGVDFFKYRRSAVEVSDSQVLKPPEKDKPVEDPGIVKEIKEMGGVGQYEAIKKYNEHIVKCTNAVKQSFESMKNELKNRLKTEALEDYPESYTTGKNNVWKVETYSKSSEKHLENSEKIFFELTSRKDIEKNRAELLQICLSQRQLAIDADKIWQSSQSAAKDFSENIDYTLKHQRLGFHMAV